MRRLILTRHGETAWNAADTFRGRSDIELTRYGMEQAQLLAKHLTSTRVEAVYSSPLKRAVKTAQAIASAQETAATTLPSLNDISYGDWEGMTVGAVKERYPELYARWIATPHKAVIPGGESLLHARRRTLGAVRQVADRHQGVVVMVMHKAVLQVLIGALLGLPLSRFWSITMDLCGSTTFLLENGRFVLVEHNNTSYLKP